AAEVGSARRARRLPDEVDRLVVGEGRALHGDRPDPLRWVNVRTAGVIVAVGVEAVQPGRGGVIAWVEAQERPGEVVGAASWTIRLEGRDERRRLPQLHVVGGRDR